MGDGNGDDLGILVGVELADPGFQSREASRRGLEDTVPLLGLVLLSLPPEEAAYGATDLAAGRQPLRHQGPADPLGFVLGPCGDGDLDQIRLVQLGILVSAPCFPSVMGTTPTRQPLWNWTVSRLPRLSA